MNDTRLFWLRLIRLTIWSICMALVLTFLVMVPRTLVGVKGGINGAGNVNSEAVKGASVTPDRSSNDSVANLPLTPMPYGNGYPYSRSITIDHTKVPNTDQSNFPVLISGTYSYLKTLANGGNVQNANGYDIIFAFDSICSTESRSGKL